MSAKVPTIAKGTVTPGITVAQSVRRKIKIATTTSAMARIKVCWTSVIAARIVGVRSLRMSILIAGGSAVFVGDNDIVPGPSFLLLVVVVNRERADWPVDRSLGQVASDGGENCAKLLERQAERSELRRIELDAHGRLLLAADVDKTDAGDLAEMFDQHVLGVIIYSGQRQRIGGNRKDQDRRVGRVDLAVGRRRGQVFRKL